MYSFNKAKNAVRVSTNVKKNPDMKRLIKAVAGKVIVRNVKDETFMWITLQNKTEMEAVCNILSLYDEEQVPSRVWTANWKKAKAVREELKAAKKAESGSETKSKPAPKKKATAKKKAEPKAEEKPVKKTAAKKTATKKAEPAKKTTAKKTTKKAA